MIFHRRPASDNHSSQHDTLPRLDFRLTINDHAYNSTQTPSPCLTADMCMLFCDPVAGLRTVDLKVISVTSLSFA